MQRLMTPLDRGKDLVPIALDVGAIGMKVGLKTCRRENALAQGHLF